MDAEFEYWKKFRENLTNNLKKEDIKLEKTPENLIKMSKKIGVKPTARYFNITPSQVRYFLKKYDN